ncbi:MAG: Rieske (2Fe-2S) protein [Gammaproteobacteria bacterium]
MQNMKPRPYSLCVIDDIPEDEARSFVINHNEIAIQLFIVKKANNVYAYENRCPHVGTSLDWQPNQFLDSSNSWIQCSTHGALFRIEDGFCIQGPCVNQYLTGIKVEIKNKKIIVFYPNTFKNSSKT